MRVILLNKGQKIGYLDYDIINWYGMLGQLGHIVAQPQSFAEMLRQKIQTNAFGVVVSGGDAPPDLSSYWDGVFATLTRLQSEIQGFSFTVPQGEDPLQDASLEDPRKRDRVY